MFWLATARMLLRPIPPMPTQAMLRRSLGGVNPLPRTCRGTMENAAPVAAAVWRNLRREIPDGRSFMALLSAHDIPSRACEESPEAIGQTMDGRGAALARLWRGD